MALSLFTYRRGTSVMHRIPALAKLAGLMFLCILTFAGGSYKSVQEVLSFQVVLRTAVCALITLTAFILAGARLDSLRQFSFIIIVGVAVTLLKFLSVPAMTGGLSAEESRYIIEVLPSFFINLNGLADGILYTVRFFITAVAAQVIFETTSSLEIKASLELVQEKISLVIPPVKRLNPALVVSLAINFIPQVFDTWNRVSTAARARSDIKHKKSRKKAALSLFVLFQELQSLLSCLLYQAETTRKAVLNRSCDD